MQPLPVRRELYVRNASRCFRSAFVRTRSHCALSLRSGCFGPTTLTRDVIGCGLSRPSSRGCVRMGDGFFLRMKT
jgi:hypothetical protein